MKRTVFYSWQSDLPNPTNRGFIQGALEGAAKTIADDDSVAVEPVVDRDTSGVPGSPDIAATIFSKISAADVVVVDISIINSSQAGRPTPNPNVLIELGYALKSLGHERVVLVFNEAYGAMTDLPFDLRARRLVVYNMPEETKDRSPERRKLQKTIEGAIRSALTNMSAPDDDSSMESNIEHNAWLQENEAASRKGISAFGANSFMEVRSCLLNNSLKKARGELKDAARDSQIQTFGWPIGICTDTDEYRPKPNKNGINAEISIKADTSSTYDYWTLHQNGSFYLLRSLFEDQRRPGFIFFNTRVVQIAESLMYLSNLYKELSISETQKFSVEIRHVGLQGREISAAGARSMRAGRKASENENTTSVTTSIKEIDENLAGLVKEFTTPLFEMFDFFKVNDEIVDDIVEKFKNGQVT